MAARMAKHSVVATVGKVASCRTVSTAKYRT